MRRRCSRRALPPCGVRSHIAIANIGQTHIKSSYLYRNEGTAHALALLLHGDAAMAGLGIVPEAMQLADLEAYWIGGTVHVVLNNHVGAPLNLWSIPRVDILLLA